MNELQARSEGDCLGSERGARGHSAAVEGGDGAGTAKIIFYGVVI
jgi:hypothetical protein